MSFLFLLNFLLNYLCCLSFKDSIGAFAPYIYTGNWLCYCLVGLSVTLPITIHVLIIVILLFIVFYLTWINSFFIGVLGFIFPKLRILFKGWSFGALTLGLRFFFNVALCFQHWISSLKFWLYEIFEFWRDEPVTSQGFEPKSMCYVRFWNIM